MRSLLDVQISASFVSMVFAIDGWPRLSFDSGFASLSILASPSRLIGSPCYPELDCGFALSSDWVNMRSESYQWISNTKWTTRFESL